MERGWTGVERGWKEDERMIGKWKKNNSNIFFKKQIRI